MNEILKKRIEEAANRFAHLYPKVSVADVITFRRDAFIAGAIEALNSQWISVKEALPEYDNPILVAYGYEDYCLSHRSNNPNVLTDNNGFCNYGYKEVVAWMPIPEFTAKERR